MMIFLHARMPSILICLQGKDLLYAEKIVEILFREQNSMGNYTPEQLDKVFAVPLLRTAKKIHRAAVRLSKLIKEEKCEFGYAPLRGTMAEQQVKQLEMFGEEVELRVRGIMNGTYRFQEKTREKLKEKYEATKKKRTKQNKQE